MKIAFIAKFNTKSKDEENYATTLERLGCTVSRIDERLLALQINGLVDEFNPDIVLWFKLGCAEPKKVREHMRKYKTVCWIFDLYIGYQKEHKLVHPAFTADYVFTTDGGHQEEFKKLGINHYCVRQGIFDDECFMEKGDPSGIAFIGSNNPFNTDRVLQLKFISKTYFDFIWYGKYNTYEKRGIELNKIFANTKIIIGDSVYSPHYWSNRVVETLGRGGFLIHQYVEGITEEYPYLITYERGNPLDLKAKIDYYLEHEDERLEIVKKNYEWVKEHYLMKHKCEELLLHLV